jgi:hypothetical protein
MSSQQPEPIDDDSSGAPECFVIMPFTDPDGYEAGHFNRVFKNIFVKACQDAGFHPVRADQDSQTKVIHKNVMERLAQAEMVLCDLSGRNPNVLFELGLRQAFDKPFVLVKDYRTESIVDVDILTFVRYDEGMAPYEKVVEAQDAITKSLRLTYAASRRGEVNSIPRLLSPDRMTFPQIINNSIKEQLEMCAFYRQNMVYKIEVADVSRDGVTFITELSHTVKNRTARPQIYYMTYDLKDERKGRVLEARFNERVFDLSSKELRRKGHESIKQVIPPNGPGRIFFRASEQFGLEDSELYTTWMPASDLKVIIVNGKFKDRISFFSDSLYYEDAEEKRSGDSIELTFNKGLLPYQGVRLYWRGEYDE